MNPSISKTWHRAYIMASIFNDDIISTCNKRRAAILGRGNKPRHDMLHVTIFEIRVNPLHPILKRILNSSKFQNTIVQQFNSLMQHCNLIHKQQSFDVLGEDTKTCFFAKTWELDNPIQLGIFRRYFWTLFSQELLSQGYQNPVQLQDKGDKYIYYGCGSETWYAVPKYNYGQKNGAPNCLLHTSLFNMQDVCTHNNALYQKLMRGGKNMINSEIQAAMTTSYQKGMSLGKFNDISFSNMKLVFSL